MSHLRSLWVPLSVCLTLMLLAAGCTVTRMTTSTPIGDWKIVHVGGVLTIQVPPDSVEEPTQPIDSIIGILNGPGYRIVYDYGRFGEPVEANQDRPGFQSQTRQINGRPATQASFVDVEESPERPFVHLLQVADEGSNTLTLRISCVDAETCWIVTPVFDSVSSPLGLYTSCV